MGKGIIFKCNHCGYEEELFSGIGMFCDGAFLMQKPSENEKWKEFVEEVRILKKVEELMTNKQGVILQNKSKKDGTMKFYYGYRYYYSKQQKRLFSKFYFKCKYKENEIEKYYTPDYEDEEGNKLKLVNEVYNYKHSCSECGCEMEEKGFMLWD